MNNDVYFQLGKLGVTWEQAQANIRLAQERAAVQHNTGAKGYVILYAGSKPTGKRLVYDSGVDGADGKFWIEDIPAVHVDWDMTAEEWEELRFALWYTTDHGPYINALREAGKLGPMPAPKPKQLFDGKILHVVSRNRNSLGSLDYACSCGHYFISLHDVTMEPHPCPLDPEHIPCR